MNTLRDIKVNRVLNIFERLMSGEIINKKKEAEKFGVNEKTIQRDIEDIRAYFQENIDRYNGIEISYLRSKRGYVLSNSQNIFLNKKEVLAISKILLESRAFNKEEMIKVIGRLLNQVGIYERRQVNELILNELFNFVPLSHNKMLLDKIWDISEIIRAREGVEITYIKANSEIVTRTIKPVSIIFSEYYFYLIAYLEDKRFKNPTIFRIDRIDKYKRTGRKFYITYSNRFEEGEFRKRIQFMYQGELIKLKFEFYGADLASILDRLPTAKIITKANGRVLIQAEVFGKGIIMWLLSQGENVKVISPKKLVEDIKYKNKKINELYKNKN